MKLKSLILTLFLAAALPLLAYEAPITEPGATGVNDMYTTTYGSPSHAPGGPNRVSGGAGEQEGVDDPFDPNPGSPIGAPWILLGFAAAYGAFRLKKGE